MFTSRPVAPLALNTKANTNGKAKLFTAAAFQYMEEPASTNPNQTASINQNGDKHPTTEVSPVKKIKSPRATGMSEYPGSRTASSGMYVRALYGYVADDKTSLSFRQGDLIQVITQLETGWWDGIINGVRGWFPSNYCAVVTAADDDTNRGRHIANGEEASGESGTEDEYEEYEEEPNSNQSRDARVQPPPEEREGKEQEEAAFWIPQATPDGRLFYFNTLTGVSTMELPLETPTSADEPGPLDRMNINVPDQTRPPPEMMARGYEREEYEGDGASSASEAEEELARRRRSYISDGVSPAASLDSLNASPVIITMHEPQDFYNPDRSISVAQQTSISMPASGITATSFTNNPVAQISGTMIPHTFFDDENTPPLTWNRLVENMRRSIDSYRQVISNADRSEYVRRAEDISDHLRMLLAAGSGTTDNHSGNPSIISTNNALYPHFRDMMSRFSKLVLSSHIAAADWPAPDSYAKCLQEAEGVLHGVYGYVEVARSQRGEDIPRLVPGFVLGSDAGGSWLNNNMGSRDLIFSTSSMDQDHYEPYNEHTAKLDGKLLERVNELRVLMVPSIRRLDEQLTITEKIITPVRHEQIGNLICASTGKVIDFFRPWIATVESIDLAALGSTSQNSQMTEFVNQKQRSYDTIADLLMAAQAVAGPLGDEWAEVRGDPLEERLREVQVVAKQLETCASQLCFSLQLLLDTIQQERATVQIREAHRKTDGGAAYQANSSPNHTKQSRRPLLGDMSQPSSYSEGMETAPEVPRADISKIKRFFGEVPSPIINGRHSEETPAFLRLDHEGDIAYDTKHNPPQLRGGTLTALVEQLTRHDRLDSHFNNTFLLTYRSFTTATELFEMLVRRFSIQPPRGISEDDYKTWVDKKQKPIRFRVVNILKSWFDHYWMENNDQASNELLRRVYSFAKGSVETTKTPGSVPLISIVEQRLKGHDANAKRLVLTMNTPTPVPIMPKNMKKLKFLDIDATEFARQLTIIESRLYGKIKPTECLNKTWQKKVSPEEPEPAVNVKALILHSNQLTNWVAEMILTQSDVKKRVVVIKHFVSVADKCRALNNFSTLTSIISALSTAPIHRLNRTWQQVNARTSSVLEQMRRLMGSTKNFADYRETLHLANPPCIPFFGVYLTDLTFIEDGIPSVIKRTNLINFAKRAKTAEVIRDIQQYQNVPYPLQPVPELQDYILSNMQAAGDVHEMYDKSLAVEPREREDEKIARLLSESGFL
ncbi:MAG: ras GEF [Lasallia pustulata]|uniref:Class E vacuolar protein-sorting machinery protein HSE1 n=1 Tax=Lasallia pustulata TaxID=136370 RepID=A0A5M8PIS0_9LECA|nr:MAG: ras GEF [Lasallia pustulata]